MKSQPESESESESSSESETETESDAAASGLSLNTNLCLYLNVKYCKCQTLSTKAEMGPGRQWQCCRRLCPVLPRPLRLSQSLPMPHVCASLCPVQVPLACAVLRRARHQALPLCPIPPTPAPAHPGQS
ncbi:GH12839 [Drosophila grimshawi]|uniref:GH12839 n=1 Tax=Drosophila grimshawi TaxID=7222 RepID=B4JLD7_DROGR|nr:GH12839 [Drosophila grimshawi]